MYVQTIDGIATSFYACFYVEGNLIYVTKQAQASCLFLLVHGG
jgi:hypothetical protein